MQSLLLEKQRRKRFSIVGRKTRFSISAANQEVGAPYFNFHPLFPSHLSPPWPRSGICVRRALNCQWILTNSFKDLWKFRARQLATAVGDGSRPQTHVLPPDLCHSYMHLTHTASAGTLTWRPFCFRNFRWTFWFPQKEAKWLPTDTFPYLEIYRNVFAASAPARIPLGKLPTLHRPPTWTWRPLLGGEGKGMIRKWRWRKERGGYKRKGGEIGPKGVYWACPWNAVAPGTVIDWLRGWNVIVKTRDGHLSEGPACSTDGPKSDCSSANIWQEHLLDDWWASDNTQPSSEIMTRPDGWIGTQMRVDEQRWKHQHQQPQQQLESVWWLPP